MYVYQLDDEGNREFSPDQNPTVDQPPNKVRSSLPDPMIKCEGNRCKSRQSKNNKSKTILDLLILREERQLERENTVPGTPLFHPDNFV